MVCFMSSLAAPGQSASLWASVVAGWSLGLLALVLGSVVVVDTAGVADLSQSSTFVWWWE